MCSLGVLVVVRDTCSVDTGQNLNNDAHALDVAVGRYAGNTSLCMCVYNSSSSSSEVEYRNT